MSRVQHSKPSRRLAWAAAALVLLALPTAAPASAQGFFFLFGGPSPYEIERQLAAAGYLVTSPLTLRGDVYLVDVVVRGEGPERLVLDAHSGRIVERYRGRADRWREAAAPPPSAWGDDPSQWNAPRPPTAIGPAAAPPPDAFAPPKPDVLEAPKEAKPRIVETKPKPTPKPTPVANVNNPPPAAVVPPLAAKPPAAPPAAVSSSPAAAPLSPNPAPSAAAAPASPAPAAPPSPAIEAAKTDAPGVAKPLPPSAAAPAKSKVVNDIPVTPLD
jgi:hypothetical protein